MVNIKILNKENEDDIKQFTEILDEFALFHHDDINSLYFYEDMCYCVDWLKTEFKNRKPMDFIAVGLFNQGELIRILVGYKIEVAWRKPVVEDTVPYYVVGLMYFRDREWAIPAERIDDLDEVVTSHFENQGYTKGFMVIKAPKFIINNSSATAIDEYMNKVFVKTFYGNKHLYKVEHVFRTPADAESYKFRAFRVFLPLRVKRPLCLISFELKSEYRQL